MKYPYVDEEKGWIYFNEELIIVNENVKMKWHHANKQHYIDLGYIFTKLKDIFYVEIKDLMKGCGVKVDVICPIPTCQHRRKVNFYDLTGYNHSKCKACARFIDLTGEEYYGCIAQKFLGKNKQGYKMYEWLCHCGEYFITQGQSVKYGNTKSCGCYQKQSMKERMIGDTNPNYNFDLTDTDRENKRITPEYRAWKRDVKIRDDFTCQCCGGRGLYLESHHLNNFSDFPEQRLDLDNGVTLCKSCHYKFHWDYMGGTKNNCTDEDFILFCKDFSSDANFS